MKTLLSMLAFASVVTAGGTGICRGQTQAPEPTTPGLDKFPEEIFAPTVIGRGYVGESLLQTFLYSIGGTVVQRSRAERANDSEPWGRLHSSEGTTYILTALASCRGGDEVYVAGINPDASCVIERWTGGRRRGGWQVEVPHTAQPIGSPQPLTPPVLSVSGGATNWQPVPQTLTSLPAYSRTVVYTTEHGPLHGMDVDPDVRYLVVYDMELKALLQLSLLESPPVETVLASVATLPHLDQVGSVRIMDFGTSGRKCLVTREYTSHYRASQQVYTLFNDTDNDGVFESHASFSASEWNSSVYSDWSLWVQPWQEQ